MNSEQLRALRAIVDEGSFEAAADELGISASAVSQRIRALERTVGHVVVRRGSPCVPTEAGTALVRMARHLAVLEEETWASLGRQASGRTVTSLAVPADALGTWFEPVLRAASEWDDTVLDMRVEDQDHSAELLRRGEVLAAVTTEPTAAPGCTVEPLGRMRYVPVVAPALLRRHTTRDGVDLAALPVMRFNAKDGLQDLAMAEAGVTATPPTHLAPSFDAFQRCVEAGLGWGMLVDHQATRSLADGRLVRLPGLEDVLVPLHWQAVTLPSVRLIRLTDAVRAAAARGLEGGGGPGAPVTARHRGRVRP